MIWSLLSALFPTKGVCTAAGQTQKVSVQICLMIAVALASFSLSRPRVRKRVCVALCDLLARLNFSVAAL